MDKERQYKDVDTALFRVGLDNYNENLFLAGNNKESKNECEPQDTMERQTVVSDTNGKRV